MRKILISTALVLVLPTMVSAQELTGSLKKIKETGAITIGFRDSSVPFSYLNQDNKPVGYSIDICMKIVEAVKQELKGSSVEVVLLPVTSATRIPLIANGTVDLECGSTTNNVERQKQVAFTNTSFLTASAFVSKKSSNLKKIDDLKGKAVVSTAGTTNIKQVNEANTARNLGMNVMPAKDHAESFLMMETGRAEAFVMDDVLLAALVASSKDPAAYQISDEAFSLPEPYAIMLRRDDPQFKALVDKTTASLLKSPEGAALYAKWFTSKIPPKDLNLNAPMSPALKKAFANPTDSADPKAY